MNDPTTPTTGTPTEDPAPAAYLEQMQKALGLSTAENMENLQRMRTEEDNVTIQLAEEICERLAQLARRFDIPYTDFFPLQACDFLMPKWQASAAHLKSYIEEGDAKTALDARYGAEAGT